MQPKCTVLVVDDEAELLASMKTVLTQMLGRDGVEIVSAATPDAALEALDALDPTSRRLVLSDYNLNARLTGSQLLSEVKRRAPGVRRILMSGYDQSTLPRDALEDELDGFVCKPFDLPVLIKFLRGLIETTPAAVTR